MLIPAGGNNGNPTGCNKIVVTGLPRAGKTSINRVVFQKVPPHETLFLETTHKPELKNVRHNSLIQFQVSDLPGMTLQQDPNFVDTAALWSCGALVFVIDAQEENQSYYNALAYAKRVITGVYMKNPKVYFEIFIHKVDGDMFLHEENRNAVQSDIHSRLTDELYSTCPDLQISFHVTSIYDHSVFEAMSKVVQKLIVELPVLEQLIDLLVTNCRIEKGFLFDVVSKIYIATDSGPIDGSFYEYQLCSDMIDVVIDVSCIYGLGAGDDAYNYDAQSSCVIQLTNGLLLYLKQVEHFLAFACIIREENFDRQYLLDYNINVFKESLQQLSRLIQSRNSPASLTR
ncbi:unnamed protein product [Amoebophrya sp. A25]|nr:unnamed protein product [Amoebophrya sp. A25]|eukprot:GSA25T00019884001.1